jgi:hypothetical protein
MTSNNETVSHEQSVIEGGSASGNKPNCFPLDQSLSVNYFISIYYFPFTQAIIRPLIPKVMKVIEGLLAVDEVSACMGFNHTVAVSKNLLSFLLNLALKRFQSRPRGEEQLILFSWPPCD